MWRIQGSGAARDIALGAITAGWIAAAVIGFGIGSAVADGEPATIDCAGIAMQFTAPGYRVACKDLSDPTALDGGARVEQLTAISDDDQRILVAVDLRALGAIFLKRRQLEDDFRSSFGKESVADWRPADDVADYEYAEYTGRNDQGGPAQCIVFRRQMNRRNEGYGRKVLGFGCTTGDRAAIVETLKLLDAPGD